MGTLTSAEGPAVSVVAKENKIVFIAPIPKTDQLTAADKLHPYVFRVAANTTMEGRSAAEIVAKWPVTKIATIAFDYAYGQDVTKSFVEHIKRIKPGVEIVDQQWPKLGEQDYNPFINAQMAKKPDAVVSSIWGGFFVTFSKQAKALGYFDAIKYNFIGLGEAGSPETTKSMGADYPVGIWGNSYDAFYWEDNPGPHKDYTARLSKYLKDEYPSSWAIQGYIGMDRGDQEGGEHGLGQGLQGAPRADHRHAHRQADPSREGSPGEPRPALRKDGEGPEVQLPDHEAHHLHRSDQVHGLGLLPSPGPLPSDW